MVGRPSAAERERGGKEGKRETLGCEGDGEQREKRDKSSPRFDTPWRTENTVQRSGIALSGLVDVDPDYFLRKED